MRWYLGLFALLALACRTKDDVIATLRASGGQITDQGGAAGAAGGPAVGPSPCALLPGEQAALARYDFEDAEGATLLRDQEGLVDAQVVDGTFAPAAGPEGCGNAFAFGDAGLFVQIPNAPSWDLDEGSVDFWFRVPEVAGAYGILGRDHLGTDSTGHFSVWLTPDNTVTLRLQGPSPHATHCSEAPLVAGQWAHVGFNFGAAGSELWVEGVLAMRTGDPRIETIVPECGGSTPDGISGNDQPWVLGFDTSRSGDMLEGLLQHFSGGALDALQISAVRRDFQSR